MEQAAGRPYGLGKGRTRTGGHCAEDFTHHTETVPPTEARRNHRSEGLVEEDGAHPVTACRREGEEARHLGDEVVHRHHPGPETRRGRKIDEQQDGEVALFAISLDVELTGARGDVPVDGADVIAIAVLPNLLELEAETPEGALVLTREPGLHGLAGADLQTAHLGPEFGAGLVHRVHRAWTAEIGGQSPSQGTSTASNIRSTTSSTLTPSASAS